MTQRQNIKIEQNKRGAKSNTPNVIYGEIYTQKSENIYKQHVRAIKTLLDLNWQSVKHASCLIIV